MTCDIGSRGGTTGRRLTATSREIITRAVADGYQHGEQGCFVPMELCNLCVLAIVNNIGHVFAHLHDLKQTQMWANELHRLLQYQECYRNSAVSRDDWEDHAIFLMNTAFFLNRQDLGAPAA